MFDWFKNMFQIGRFSGAEGGVDPEAGVVANEYTGIGNIQGPDEGTGEGSFSFSNRQQYEKVGRALQQQALAAAPSLIAGGINAGFDQNWLGSSSTLGSAMGQKIG